MFGSLLSLLYFSNRSKNLYPVPMHLLRRFREEELGHNRLHEALFLVRSFSSRKSPLEEESDLSDWVSEINSKSLRPPLADLGIDRGESTEVRDRSSGSYGDSGFGISSSIRGTRRETGIGRDSQFRSKKDSGLRDFRRDGSGNHGVQNPSEMKSVTRNLRGNVDYSGTETSCFGSKVDTAVHGKPGGGRRQNSGDWKPLTGDYGGNVMSSPLEKKPPFFDSEEEDEKDDSELESFGKVPVMGKKMCNSSILTERISDFENDDDDDDDEYVDDDDDDDDDGDDDSDDPIDNDTDDYMDSKEDSNEMAKVLDKKDTKNEVLDKKEKKILLSDKSSDDELNNTTTSKISSSEGSESYLSKSRFDQYELSPLTLKAIKDLGFENMTVVQEATLRIILKGLDVIAKARTGTGKTVAFLLPCIEAALKAPPFGGNLRYPPIIALIICPTRELAYQAAKEAQNLLKYHSDIGVQVFIGGVSINAEKKKMESKPIHILVATPGRLKDHIDNTGGFVTRLSGLKILVLDEADQLLDMGFRHHIENIISYAPKERQTLLFSATIPPGVREVSRLALKKIYRYIDTVPAGSEETHTKVDQIHLAAPLDQQFSIIYSLLKDHVADDADYKVLVFCTTAMVTSLVAQLLQALGLNVNEIHSRKSQNYRTRVSDEFRKSKGSILVTSDVSARGVDYPDVTLVIQVGMPSSRQQYIHRLGRTGRKGKVGEGILLLAPWEEFFLHSISDLPLKRAQLPIIDPTMTKEVMEALSRLTMKTKESAYQAWLGYYNGLKGVGSDKTRLVALASDFSKSMGLPCPPAIGRNIVGKMGLKNVPGLNLK